MHLDWEEIVRLSPVRELEALLEGRQWENEGMRRKNVRRNAVGTGKAAAAHRLIHRPVLIVAALISSAWVFSDQQGDEGERAT
jgi:hypothetical protein